MKIMMFRRPAVKSRARSGDRRDQRLVRVDLKLCPETCGHVPRSFVRPARSEVSSPDYAYSITNTSRKTQWPVYGRHINKVLYS